MCDKIYINNQVINFKYVRKLEIFTYRENNDITSELLVVYDNIIGKTTETSVTVHVNKPLDLKKLQQDMDEFLTNQIINAEKLIDLSEKSIRHKLVELTGAKEVTMYVKTVNNDTALDGYVLLKDNNKSKTYLIWTGEVWDVARAKKELKEYYSIVDTCSMYKSKVKELIQENKYWISKDDFYSMTSQALKDEDYKKLIPDDLTKVLGEI